MTPNAPTPRPRTPRRPRALQRAAALAAAALLGLAPHATQAQVFGGKAIGVVPARGVPQRDVQRWALVVGINDYNSVPRLRFARQDAQAMARALVEHCGFPKDNVVLMTDDRDVRVDRPHLYPTRSNLRNRINRIAEIAGKDDVLLIFYSGHGVNLGGEAHLVPVDGNDRDPGSLVPLRWVTSTVESSPATQRMLILDACHAGAKSGVGGDSAAERINATIATAAFQTLASCGPQELSHENPETGHGVFATALLEGLEGRADAEGEGNRDGSITADELFDYASLRVKRWSFATGKRQTPVLKGQRQGPVTIARGAAPALAPPAEPDPKPVIPPEDATPDRPDSQPEAEPATEIETETRPRPRPGVRPPAPPMEQPVRRYAPTPEEQAAAERAQAAAKAEAEAAQRPQTVFDLTPPRGAAPDAPAPAAAFGPVANDRLTMALISGPADPLAPTAILTVNAHGGSPYTELADAVEAAPAGALILVRPGTYKKRVTVDKPVEIRGTGDLGLATLTASRGHALRLATPHAVVRNLAVAAKPLLWIDAEAVHVESGAPWLIGCDIASESHACVAAAGDAAPVLVGCTLRDGETSGVYAADNAHVTVEGGLIYGHAKYGVEARDKARITLRHAAVYDNGKSGVYAHENSHADVQACEVYGNRQAGLVFSGRAQATVTHTTVRNNAKRGIQLDGDAETTFESCRVYANAGPGIELRDRVAPEFTRTAVTGNDGPAVRRRDSRVTGRFVGGELTGNTGGLLDHPGERPDVTELTDLPTADDLPAALGSDAEEENPLQ